MAQVPTAPDPQPARIEAMRAATVALLFEGPDGMRIGCGGVWIGRASILTAAHCVEPNFMRLTDAFMFQTYDEIGTRGPAEELRKPPYHYAYVTARDVKADLALLATARDVVHPLVFLSPYEGYTGEPVHLVGHAYGLAYSWAPGFVSAVRNGPAMSEGLEGWFTQVVGESRPGNSGGGLWDADGRLLGICSHSDRGGMSFYVAQRAIASFLATHLVD